MLRVSIYCVEKDLLRPVTPNLMTQDASRAHYLDLAFSGDLISFHFLSFESEKQPSIPDVSCTYFIRVTFSTKPEQGEGPGCEVIAASHRAKCGGRIGPAIATVPRTTHDTVCYPG